MKKQTLIGTAVLLAFAATGFAWAQPGEGGSGGRGKRNPEKRIERMIERLDLSDEQAEKIKGIHADGQAARMKIQKELRRLRNQIEGEMLKDNVNKQAVLNLTKQAGDKGTELRVMAVEHLFQIREILTLEQREKFMAMRSQRGGRGGAGHGGPGRGHGQGQGYGR